MPRRHLHPSISLHFLTPLHYSLHSLFFPYHLDTPSTHPRRPQTGHAQIKSQAGIARCSLPLPAFVGATTPAHIIPQASMCDSNSLGPSCGSRCVDHIRQIHSVKSTREIDIGLL